MCMLGSDCTLMTKSVENFLDVVARDSATRTSSVGGGTVQVEIAGMSENGFKGVEDDGGRRTWKC